MRTAFICGLETQSAALARQRQAHGGMRIATLRADVDSWLGRNADLSIVQRPNLSLESLRQAGADESEA